jgi:hypothetical protein
MKDHCDTPNCTCTNTRAYEHVVDGRYFGFDLCDTHAIDLGFCPDCGLHVFNTPAAPGIEQERRCTICQRARRRAG